VKFVTYERLKSDYGIKYCRVHLARLEKRGQFPRRRQISENRIGWLENEITDWIASRPLSTGGIE
jgi:prophage regulatory protein